MVIQDLSSRPEFLGSKRVVFMGVFDGHAGFEAAQYLATHYIAHLLASPLLLGQDYVGALSHALQECEAEFMETHCKAGSTALVALMVDR